MRIAFVSTMEGVPWGGSEDLWSQTALRLKNQGHQVAASVLKWPETPPMIDRLSQAGVEVFFREWPKMDLASRLRRKIRPTPSHYEVIKNWAPQLTVISQGSATSGVEWPSYFGEAGLPFAAILHLNSEVFWPSDILAAKLRAICRSAKRIFCVSNANLRLLVDQIGEEPPRAEVIRNPFNLSMTGDGALPWPQAEHGWNAACVARLEPADKGQDILLKLLAQEKWRKRPFLVSFYGSGRSANTVKRLAEKLELTQVSFPGFTKRVESIWENSHLLILPSRNEGLPLALVEASFCGRPAVVTDVGGNAEMCVDSETGFVAEAPTIIQLDQALERAWARRSDWPELGRAARHLAEKNIPTDPVAVFCEKVLRLANEVESPLDRMSSGNVATG